MSGFSDTQLLQQNIMFKQLQELQRRKQLKDLYDTSHQNHLHPLSAKSRQPSGGQFSSPLNGTPIRDPSQMFNMNLVQHGGLPAVQGFPNALPHQQFDPSLFGAPIASARNNLSQYSHMQGIYRDSVQKSSFGGEQAGFPGPFPGKSTQVNSSQGLATLDPLEEKILYNVDENSWDASLGGRTNVGSSFGNTVDDVDNLSSFHSIQSGSWSALMQSAVAEASSSDTGLQEEWSGSVIPSEPYDNQQNCYQRENSSDIYHSNASKQTITGHDLKENWWQHGDDSRSVSEGNEKSSGQVLDQQYSQGPRSREQGSFGEFKFMGTSNGAMNLEKGYLPDVQSSRGNVGANLSSSVDRSSGFYSRNDIVQPSQNMLELLPMVDHDSDSSNIIRFGSPVTERGGASVAKQYDPSSASQHFGLRLAPLSQRLPNSNNDFSSQNSPKTGNSAAISSSVPPYSRNQIHMQHISTAFMTPKDINYSLSMNPFGQEFPILEAAPVTQPSIMSVMSQQVGSPVKPTGLWTNVATQPRLSGTESHKVSSSLVLSSDSTNNNIENTLWAPHELHDQTSQTNAIGSGSLMARSNQQHFGGAKYGCNQVPAVSARDFEAFGRSLKPSHTVKNIEADPTKRALEKYNGHNDVNSPVNNELKAVSHVQPFSSAGTKVLSFSSYAREDHSAKYSSQPLHQQTPLATIMVDQNYGVLKNGQMLQMYDAKDAKKAAQFLPGKPFENLPMNTVRNLTVVRPKKRKIAMSVLLPWNKEVTQGSERPESIRMAELEWARAANRLIEKVEAEAEMREDVKPMFRTKKRLILTTQLMQQVFRPAPGSILLAEAVSNYDSVAYFAARHALGDACSLTYCSKTCDLMSEKAKVPERLGEHHFSKIMEDLTNRAEKLETYFSRLENIASILDIRVESQELEKFCVINRFAKFHRRGQSDAGGISSSFSTSPTVRKTCRSKYVTALPMPRTVPEGAKCLSL